MVTFLPPPYINTSIAQYYIKLCNKKLWHKIKISFTSRQTNELVAVGKSCFTKLKNSTYIVLNLYFSLSLEIGISTVLGDGFYAKRVWCETCIEMWLCSQWWAQCPSKSFFHPFNHSFGWWRLHVFIAVRRSTAVGIQAVTPVISKEDFLPAFYPLIFPFWSTKQIHTERAPYLAILLQASSLFPSSPCMSLMNNHPSFHAFHPYLFHHFFSLVRVQLFPKDSSSHVCHREQSYSPLSFTIFKMPFCGGWICAPLPISSPGA